MRATPQKNIAPCSRFGRAQDDSSNRLGPRSLREGGGVASGRCSKLRGLSFVRFVYIKTVRLCLVLYT